ncbi:3-alpha-hydroxysteroid dehydrogenase [Pseudoxanthomonas jiangsuensis]|uniref:SDR family NAD(P)-dependent oxidoreductase n=1 Tax=Pseudoxanthomonas jiangsuensis TaxID=619688 RepID=UPI001390D77C|nr:glucose 1-dehydrogenase [Pseudoxanthomonas jiangsuensis]KAF1697247.1 3-alpha-hydroxysteroid dehydrogenase [Pseudoxanthomonas jiangsuensis]
MDRFKDKVVVVTGASRGMGRAHVQEFVREGAFVFFTDISEDEGKQLEIELDGRARFVRQDVTKEEDWKSLVALIDEAYGRLDVLVNNAGVAIQQPIGKMSLETYMKVVDINQVSVFLGLTHTFELLKRGRSPSVVNIASIAGIKTSKGGVAYSASKFAVRGMTELAAQEWAPLGIRVNSICPGAVETPMTMQDDVKELMAALKQTIPLGRIAKPIEITKAVMFLASEDSSYATGAHLVMDGGAIIKFGE